MPNYCLNRLTLEGTPKDVAELLAFIKGEHSDFDFNNVIPIPPSIEDTQRGSVSFASEAACHYLNDKTINTHMQWLIDKNQLAEDEITAAITRWIEEKRIDIALGYRIIENRRQFDGCGDWYEWCVENWGTKWTACEADVDGNVITFETAWAPCSPIVEKLSELYPKITMEYCYFEPGISLAGRERYCDGECVQIQIYDYDEDDYRLIGESFGYDFY